MILHGKHPDTQTDIHKIAFICIFEGPFNIKVKRVTISITIAKVILIIFWSSLLKSLHIKFLPKNNEIKQALA